jgi:hypothetical protein
MGRLAVLLALSMAWTHVGTGLAAQYFSEPARAWEHLQYISKGFDAVLLYGAILWLACRLERGRTWRMWWLAVVCVLGAFLQLMNGVCGVGYWQFGGMADNLVGLCYATQQWGFVALLVGAGILAGVSWSINHV